MASDERPTTGRQGNGGAQPEGGGETQPQLRLLAQYVKDLSFENPNAPAALAGGGGSPKIDISVDVQAARRGDTEFEVDLKIAATAKRDKDVAFIVELSYGGLFQLSNIPAEQLQPVVLIECPRLLFPFARRVLADATRDGGFPPLMIDPIDFVALYQRQLAAETKRQDEPSTERAGKTKS